MPKESKKFINPLLRPSQEAEVKGEPPARIQKNIVGGASTLEDFEVVEEIDARYTERSPQRGSTSKQEASSAIQITKTSTETYPSTEMLSTTTENGQKKAFREGQNETVSSSFRVSDPQANESNSSRAVTDSKRENIYSAPEPKSILSPVPSPYNEVSDPSAPKKTSTSTSTSTETATEIDFSAQTLVQTLPTMNQTTIVDQEQEEKQERPSFRAMEAVRRRKGPLAFEKTHERITVWIDKGLKQAFEELALDRELPKTALLNEAVADLLRKYEM